jgi:hypothetical protein
MMGSTALIREGGFKFMIAEDNDKANANASIQKFVYHWE